jgi:hypothetical protein
MVGKIIANRVGTLEFRDYVVSAKKQGGRPIPKPHFVEIPGLGLTTVRSA